MPHYTSYLPCRMSIHLMGVGYTSVSQERWPLRERMQHDKKIENLMRWIEDECNELGFDPMILNVITAEDLILKRYMKPIDSIQLAIALNLKRDDITFVSSHRSLR